MTACGSYWTRTFGSVVRALRTGPTSFASLHWYSAMNRVMPPSTSSS